MIHEGWDRLFIPEPMSGCWLWLGDVSDKGYAIKGWYPAYRLFWEMCNGPTPEGMSCRHTCDNSLCVNPEHIVLGTTLQNMRDKVRRGRCQDQRGEKGPSARLTSDDIGAIRKSTESQSVLAKRYGVSQGHISRIVRGGVWGHLAYELIDRSGRNGDLRGEECGSAKLTKEQVISIRAELGSQSKIAIKFGVSQALISQIKRRKIWDHI